MRTIKLLALLILTIFLATLTLFGKQGPKRNEGSMTENGDGWKKAHTSHRRDMRPGWGMTVEGGVRHYLTEAPMPRYPDEALADQAHGRIATVVLFGDDFTVFTIKVLKSPHPAISRAVIEAVKDWKTEPVFSTDGTPLRVLTEIRFDFVITDGRGEVRNPSEEEMSVASQDLTRVVAEEIREAQRHRENPQR